MDIFYYHVFGGIGYLKQCLLSLITLRYVGLCNHDVIIFTDNVDRVTLALQKLNLTHNTYVQHVTHSRPLFGRYVCALKLIGKREYRYVTYLDNDIVINKPLNEFLTFPYQSQFFIRCEENVPKGLSGYFEVTASVFGSTEPLTVNSGLFTFLANDFSQNIFKEVLNREKHYPSPHYNKYGDQPIFATVLKNYNLDQTHLKTHEKLINTPVKTNSKTLKTFTHYNVGHTVKGKYPELLRLTSKVAKSLECINKIRLIDGVCHDLNIK